MHKNSRTNQVDFNTKHLCTACSNESKPKGFKPSNSFSVSPSLRRPGFPTFEQTQPNPEEKPKGFDQPTSSNPLRGFSKPSNNNDAGEISQSKPKGFDSQTSSDRLLQSLSEPSNNDNNGDITGNSFSHVNRLWLSSKLIPQPEPEAENVLCDGSEFDSDDGNSDSVDDSPSIADPEVREEGKLFVGNLPLWITKTEVAAFFRQFGPVKNVILIKGHDDPERNVGYCFVIYGGPTADNCAIKAVEFDGVEFHGRILTVKLDDGRRLKAIAEQRRSWVEGVDGRKYRSKWHEEREKASKDFKRILETHPDKWQKVINAFLKIKKCIPVTNCDNISPAHAHMNHI
eukprot:Gb_31760 [translate_table: standard]